MTAGARGVGGAAACGRGRSELTCSRPSSRSGPADAGRRARVRRMNWNACDRHVRRRQCVMPVGSHGRSTRYGPPARTTVASGVPRAAAAPARPAPPGADHCPCRRRGWPRTWRDAPQPPRHPGSPGVAWTPCALRCTRTLRRGAERTRRGAGTAGPADGRAAAAADRLWLHPGGWAQSIRPLRSGAGHPRRPRRPRGLHERRATR